MIADPAIQPEARAGPALLEHAVDHGMYPYRFYDEYCPFMEPLRGCADFGRIVARARQRVEAFAA